ncbi:PREDICTED: polygalacturonase inhibitor-like [Nelumbo nucifera]|uniref:Polygalacturonase inhibitor-like n=1 Tax=Nelumbo nucifera TaxID=4432 RepID=A0A1U8BC40_NELNU|nr:PREDICTED: polygalacturonase inhibitor-like [Nelumbo nucifera]
MVVHSRSTIVPFPLVLSLLLISSTLTLSASISQRCNRSDKIALLKIKKSFNNPQDLASWNPTTDCCESWTYVTCDSQTNRVTQLSIAQANISGEISAAIGDLPYLRILTFDLISNLHGSIPSSIVNLHNLISLIISQTNLSGPIPGFHSRLKNLDYLDLSYNQLSGSIPASLADLPHLGGLTLSHNQLTGSIPDSFGRFSGYFHSLDLSDNYLSGEIPKSFAQLNLKSVYLSHNKLVGDPSVLFKENKITENMDLSWNLLDFDLSQVMFPRTLTYLDLSHNRIRGSIPRQVTKLDLTDLDLSYNRLCGKIPIGGNVQRVGVFNNNACLCGPPLPKCK